MDNQLMLDRLAGIGIKIAPGLTEKEIGSIEAAHGIRFPQEFREFFACGLPVSGGFYNWRDLSEENIAREKRFQRVIEDSFAFDIENNQLLDGFAEKFPHAGDPAALEREVMEYLHQSPRLIPFYAHRCFFDGLDGMPIISFWQPTDSIFYGADLENYLDCEFFGGNVRWEKADMSITGIWNDLIW